ncbi:Uncharacterized protein dnm_060470 [Desulfonema magnum]|uniref:Uncharacterized protein n=1 Tax=Desulfonema magnum TaxID=45655 RepID=A0A975BRA3_9BACT|nr:Uncharacterized protein dnm_060470 [Desulfonema magnum]
MPANGGETRLFPSEAADHSGKKAGFLFRTDIRKLMIWYLSSLGKQSNGNFIILFSQRS